MQKVVKEVVWREGVTMCLEEAEIEDASKIKIDWLMGMKELESIDKEDRSVSIDNVSIVSFSEKFFFSVNHLVLERKG